MADVPGGHEFYGVEIGRKGRVEYSAAQMKAPIILTLG